LRFALLRIQPDADNKQVLPRLVDGFGIQNWLLEKIW
jgi:hypothetical protein